MSAPGQPYPWQTDPQGYLNSLVGSPVRITSGFRTPEHNAAVGGVPNSAHLRGEAFDFVPQGMDLGTAAQRIAQSGIPFDQVINEGNHVHVSFDPRDRGQVFGMNGGTIPQQAPSDPLEAMLLAQAQGHPQPQAMPQQSQPMQPPMAPSPSQPSAPDPLEALLMQQASGKSAPSAPQNAAPQAPAANPVTDALRSIPGGLGQGISALAGLPGDVQNLVGQAGTYLGNKLTGRHDTYQPDAGFSLPTSAQVNNTVSKPFGGYYKPQTTAGHYAETISSFAPAVPGGEGSLLGRLLSRAVLPGLGSETAGQATQGTPYEGTARAIGGVVGGIPSLANSGARSLGRALSAPLPPEEASLVLKYENMGGNLRPGQYNPSNIIQQGDSVLADAPFQRLAGFSPNSATAITPEAQTEQFSRLISKTFGENEPRITGDVIENAKNKIGGQISTIVGRNSVNMDQDMATGLTDLKTKLADVAPALDPTDLKRIRNTINRIDTTASKGLDGKVYQAMRQRGGLLDGLSNDSNPTVANFGQSMRNMLDDAFERQAPVADAQALNLARQQYRAVKTIEPLANKAPTGIITPNLLLGQVIKEYGNPSNAGDLGTLAQVGKSFLKAQPSSGTSERSFWRSLLTNPIKAAGETAALPLTVGSGRLLNKTINSPAARARLLGNALQNAPKQPPSNPTLPFLLANKLLTGGP